jgi:hypothetical protein
VSITIDLFNFAECIVIVIVVRNSAKREFC